MKEEEGEKKNQWKNAIESEEERLTPELMENRALHRLVSVCLKQTFVIDLNIYRGREERI